MKPRGLSLIEVVMATSVLLIVLVTIPNFILPLFRSGTNYQDKAFAAQKATQLLEELRSYIREGGETAFLKLSDFDDGPSGYKDVLTTDANVLNQTAAPQTTPGDPLSGNVWTGDRWRYLRQIWVRPANPPGTQLVTVRILYSDAANPALPRSGPPLVELSGLLQRPITENVPHQVYDVYALSLDNLPGWWADLPYHRPLLSGAASDLASRNAGLQPRIHYISRLSFGRDPYYAPYINDANPANSDNNMRWAYVYPGRITNRVASPATSGYFYVPDNLVADNYRVAVDGTMRNGYTVDGAGVVTNTGPNLALADQFNHAVRYPEELARYNALVAATPAGQPTPEPTMRMLLEQLNDPAKPLRNPILLNLHGELQPLLPLRNYADAARDPSGMPGARVVAHPEKLGYASGSTINLRVYAYLTEPDNGAMAQAVPAITIFIPTTGPNVLATARAAVSASLFSGSGLLNLFFSQSPAVQLPVGAVMPSPLPGLPAIGPGNWPISGYDYMVEVDPVFDDHGTGTATQHNGILLTLFNTPTTCPTGTLIMTGLDSSKRLYGMEYIPSAIGNFSHDLTAADGLIVLGVKVGTPTAKNTARWVISLNTSMIPGVGSPVTFETRIGNNLATGVRVDGTADGHSLNQLTNLSRTYSWVGTPVPATERYQVQGDPRYYPYLDPPGANWYNWFFDSSTSSHLSYINNADYSNLPKANGPRWDSDDFDAAALLLLWREGLMNSDAIYAAMPGYSFFYAGLGGEIGSDGSHSKFDVAGYPWHRGGAAVSAVEGEASNFASEMVAGSRLVARTDNSWFSMPWLGELAPDDKFAGWSVDGNLPAAPSSGASNSNTFYRAPFNTAFSDGTIGGARLHRLNRAGCASFFNGSGTTRAARFDHFINDATTAPLASGLGAFLSQAFSLTLPPTIDAYRPFDIATTSGGGGATFPPEWNDVEYSGRGTTLTYLDGSGGVSTNNVYYTHQLTNRTAGATVLVRPAGALPSGGRATVVINGISPQGPTASSFTARYVLAEALHAFLATGDYSGPVDDPERTVQVPRVQFQAPTDGTELADPSTVTLSWSSSWRRWDGQPYAPAAGSGWAEPAPLDYQLLLSADGGKSWRFAADGLAAYPGRRDSPHVTAATTASVDFSTFPAGPYLLRVEAYRQGMPLHYAYQQSAVTITRPGL